MAAAASAAARAAMAYSGQDPQQGNRARSVPGLERVHKGPGVRPVQVALSAPQGRSLPVLRPDLPCSVTPNHGSCRWVMRIAVQSQILASGRSDLTVSLPTPAWHRCCSNQEYLRSLVGLGFYKTSTGRRSRTPPGSTLRPESAGLD
jgi:hypothetical protein